MILRSPLFSTLLGGRRPRVPVHFPRGFGRGAGRVDGRSIMKPRDSGGAPNPPPPGCRLTDEMPGKPGFQFRGIF